MLRAEGQREAPDRSASASRPVMHLHLFLNYMAASIPHFVAFEVRTIDNFRRLCFLTTGRKCALISVIRMETIIYVAVELIGAMKPWAGANEDAAAKPFRT